MLAVAVKKNSYKKKNIIYLYHFIINLRNYFIFFNYFSEMGAKSKLRY